MYPGTYAAATPDKVAAVMAGTSETLTYGDLERRSVQLAHVLHEAGLRPGDVVARCAPACTLPPSTGT
jgi:fatty-acyl-CoA synthase